MCLLLNAQKMLYLAIKLYLLIHFAPIVCLFLMSAIGLCHRSRKPKQLICCYKNLYMRHIKFLAVLLFPMLMFGQADPQEIVDKAIVAHGGNQYTQQEIQFDFRDRSYTYRNDGGNYRYTRSAKPDEKQFLDVLTNSGFNRWQDGEIVSLTAKELKAYHESVNSVVYFAILPYFLNDAAVNKRYLGKKSIKGTNYHKIEITFDKEGGGSDHDDVYVYWIDASDYSLDYLAYSYEVNGGGVRFRAAYNPRQVAGITFQDYVNYKHDKNTPVATLDDIYVAGGLKELSRIELKNISSVNN